MKKETQRNDKANSVLRRAATAQLACLIGMGFLAMDWVPRVLQLSVYAQEKTVSVKSTGTTSSVAVHVLGFEGAKRNANGKLTIEGGALEFEAGKTTARVSFPSVRDVFTDEDNRLVFGGKQGTLVRGPCLMGADGFWAFSRKELAFSPWSIRTQVGHSTAPFSGFPNGQAAEVKGQLSTALQGCGCAVAVNSSDPMARPISWRPSSAAEAHRDGQKFSSIQIEPVESADVAVPPDFRMAIYEYLIEQVQKTGKFEHVYRSGDRAASDIPDLAVLRMKVEGFRQGSEMKRAVTTVAGATSIKMSVRVLSRDGQVVFDRTVEGKVRFLGENVRATYDFAKKTAKVLNQSL